MENKEIRRANMLMLADQLGSLRALADAVESPPAYLSQIKNKSNDRGMGDDLARRIEEKLGKPRGWMDQLQQAEIDFARKGMTAREPSPNVYPGPDMRGRVPLISWVQAGNFSSIVDNLHPGDAEEWVATTVPIRPHTYALRVRGDSMTNPAGEPTFPDGAIIVVEPEVIEEPARMVGNFVIVKRSSDDEATFKQLVKDAGRYFLKPLNPRYPMLELREDDVFCGVVRERVMRFF